MGSSRWMDALTPGQHGGNSLHHRAWGDGLVVLDWVLCEGMAACNRQCYMQPLNPLLWVSAGIRMSFLRLH